MTVTFAVDARTFDPRFPGIGRYISNLLRAMPPHLHDGERLVYLCSGQQRTNLKLDDSDRLIWVGADASPFSVRQQWQIPRLLRAHDVAVYHSPYYLMPYWPGKATVLTVYDLIPQLFPEYVSQRARSLFRVTTRLALHRAAHVIAISEATREDFMSHYGVPSQQITTIPLAAAANFRPVPKEWLDKMRRQYDLPEPYVLYVGSNKPHKNLLGLVRAWRHVQEFVQGSHKLVIAGHWEPHHSAIQQEIERLSLKERISLLPNIAEQDLPALYSGADIFVFPSLYEGFGLPVLEAMACGCAVACANLSSLPELVSDAALLFEPREPSAIAQAVVELLQNPRRRQEYQRRSLQRAAAFSWSRTAAETVQIYRQIANLYPPYTRQL